MRPRGMAVGAAAAIPAIGSIDKTWLALTWDHRGLTS